MPPQAPAPSALSGRTTVLLWRPVADHWRGGGGGTAGAVLAAARVALDSPGYRGEIPRPGADALAALTGAGVVLNAAVRQRYARADAGAIAAAAEGVAAAAGAVVEGHPDPVPVRWCVGPRDRLVHLRCDARLHAAMLAAAGANGMGLGAWLRDAAAASVGEHQARRPDEATRTARGVCGRVTGLLVQAATVAADAGETEAVAAAEEALAGAAMALAGWGSRR